MMTISLDVKELKEGNKCPRFKMLATDESLTKIADFKGKNVVLYFYPKDNTPGCTCEAQDFKKKYRSFKNYNTEIVGISRDSIKSHYNFSQKYGIPYPLISDEDEQICQLFDVIKDKNMYGKKVRGIERSTFLIDGTGKIVKIWRKVKVEGHVESVLEAVKALK